MSIIIRESAPGPFWPRESRGPRCHYEGNLYFVPRP